MATESMHTVINIFCS